MGMVILFNHHKVIFPFPHNHVSHPFSQSLFASRLSLVNEVYHLFVFKKSVFYTIWGNSYIRVQKKECFIMTERVFTSPAKYMQGKNVIKNICIYLKKVVDQTIVLADETVWDIAGHHVVDELKNKKITSEEFIFKG